MLGDERPERARQLVLLGHLEPFAHVVTNDLSTRAGFELVVRISPLCLILDEVLWLGDFADVVVVRADSSEERVGADRARCRFGEVGDGNRVRIGSRRLETQPLHQRPIEVRPFEERQIGLDAGE